MPDVRIDGLDRFHHTINEAADELADLTPAHTLAAESHANQAQAAAPTLTGTLAGSITGTGTPTEAIITAGGPAIPYAGVINYGWPDHNIAAQPFLTTPLNDPLSIYHSHVTDILSRIKGT